MTTGGYGIVPYGGGPYGGGLLAAQEEGFDVFCYRDLSMFQILSSPYADKDPVDPQHFYPNPSTLDLELCSGGAKPAVNARLWVAQSVGASFTVEWIVKFANLPTDFNDLTNSHIYLGATDAAGALLGLFFSQVGVAYTGDVSFPSGNLQLNCTFQQIPASSTYVNDTDYWVIRGAVSYDLGIVYLYMTKLSEVYVTGHQLRAILPVIPYTSSAGSPTDQVLASVRGTASVPSCAFLDSMCLGSALIIPNLAPEANAGLDQAVRLCSIIQLDGSASFDPEGASLGYQWRLVEGPTSSDFVEQVHDGWTAFSASGYVTRIYSQELGAIDGGSDPVEIGDVITIRGMAYDIVGKGLDGGNFYVQTGSEVIPHDLTAETFKYLRQRGISNPTTVNPTFFPDAAGFYSFDLVVHDGSLSSSSSLTIVNVLESPLPRGCTPDMSFLFGYLSDFWKLVEDRDRVAVFWSSVAQVVATELFTLWQYEYSKSLRDIQRTFVRRWLHYDLLLPEPLPELTTVRALYGGVASSDLPSASFQGQVLHIVSEALEGGEYELTVGLAGSPTASQALATHIQNLLRDFADSRFTVTVLGGAVDSPIRVDAPFPFTIGGNTTLSIFTVGTESRHPSGTGGAGIGTRTYKVGRSLKGLDIQEDDFLNLDGVSYRISSVLDNALDAYPYQRVVVKEDLPTAPTSSWSITGWVQSELLSFYDGLVSAGDPVDFEATDSPTGEDSTETTSELVETTALGACAAKPSRLAVDFWNLGARLVDPDVRVTLARVLRRSYVPINDLVVDVPTLQRLIVVEDDEETLRRNVDYFIEDVRGRKGIHFMSGGSSDPGDVWEGERPPNRLWAEYTYVNNNPLIEANFGLAVGLTEDMLEELPTGVDYLSAVRGLWYALYNGPTIRNLRIGVQILLGLPFAEERGTIEEIRTDFSATQGRILIRDLDRTEIVRSYNYPKVLNLEENPATGAQYAVGDTVEQFAPLVEGAEVVDYIKDPTWFEGLINQGIFYEVEKYHKFLVRVDEAAFDLEALLFAKDFVLKAKPTYTYPLFFVYRNIGETEVSITDDVVNRVKLILSDAPCGNLLGASWHYDQPRAAGGGWRNQFDSNTDPNDADPTPNTPDSEVLWAYDKAYLCPSDALTGVWCEQISGSFTVFFDGPFAWDTPVTERIGFSDASPASIPAGPGGFDMTNIGDPAVDFTGNATKVRFLALGNPESDSVLRAGLLYDDDLGAYTDYTTSGTIALLPPSGAIELGDAFYMGFLVAPDHIWVNISTAGVGAWVLQYQYWNGSNWVALSGVTDGTNAFKNSGLNAITFTRPGDMAKLLVDGKGPYYYVRAVVTTGDASPSTRPVASAVDPMGVDYEVVVENVTQATSRVEAFTAIVNTEIARVFGTPLPVTAADVINVRVRPASNGARTPDWSQIMAYVTIENAAVWQYDESLGDGEYCIERVL